MGKHQKKRINRQVSIITQWNHSIAFAWTESIVLSQRASAVVVLYYHYLLWYHVDNRSLLRPNLRWWHLKQCTCYYFIFFNGCNSWLFWCQRMPKYWKRHVLPLNPKSIFENHSVLSTTSGDGQDALEASRHWYRASGDNAQHSSSYLCSFGFVLHVALNHFQRPGPSLPILRGKWLWLAH